jgi:hypothetical protein
MQLFILAFAVAITAWGVTRAKKLGEVRKKLEESIRRCKDLQSLEVARTAELLKTRSRLDDYSKKYRPLIDIDERIRNGEEDIERLQEKQKAVLRDGEKRLESLYEKHQRVLADIESAQHELSRLNQELDLVGDLATLAEFGYYEPRYEFQDIERYESELRRIRERQKAMLREDGTGAKPLSAAAFITAKLTFNNSEAQGRSAQKRIIKLALRAFNGESDSFIARVSYRNVEAMQQRIRSAYDAINGITQKYYSCALNEKYLDLKIEELRLVYEWEEAKQREKEEQARIREQMREEERAAREIEKAREQAEKEESKYEELLVKARQEAASASEKDKNRLNAKIAELMKRVAEIEEKKRAISQAMLTKKGYVYIIGNVGSFGDNVFKIGMTRRWDPMSRVQELGDASVPFPFDVHAVIPTTDAPRLENALHKHFDSRRLNLENQRKEFFRVSIEEIREQLHLVKDELGIESELHLTLIAEAKQYRMSEARRKHFDLP